VMPALFCCGRPYFTGIGSVLLLTPLIVTTRFAVLPDGTLSSIVNCTASTPTCPGTANAPAGVNVLLPACTLAGSVSMNAGDAGSANPRGRGLLVGPNPVP